MLRMTLTFAAAAELPYAALADLHQRAFAGYVVPMLTSPHAMERRNRMEDVDLFASQLALIDDVPVALALIARRGRRSRLAAMGVVERARGAGVGQALLAELLVQARARGDASLALECVTTNARALRLYRGAGFVPTRRLIGWRVAELPPEARLPLEIDPASLGRALARSDDGGLPWQLAPESLMALTAPARCWTLDDTAYVVAIVEDREISLRAVFTRPEARRRGHAARLLRALATALAPRALGFAPLCPEGLGDELAVHLGATRHELEQLELTLTLDEPMVPGRP